MRRLALVLAIVLLPGGLAAPSAARCFLHCPQLMCEKTWECAGCACAIGPEETYGRCVPVR